MIYYPGDVAVLSVAAMCGGGYVDPDGELMTIKVYDSRGVLQLARAMVRSSTGRYSAPYIVGGSVRGNKQWSYRVVGTVNGVMVRALGQFTVTEFPGMARSILSCAAGSATLAGQPASMEVA